MGTSSAKEGLSARSCCDHAVLPTFCAEELKMRNSLTLALLTLGLATAAPAPLTLSGTVNAPAGTNVKGTHVIACYPKGDECDENLTVSTQITASGGSAPFSVTVKKPANTR
ncbi:hypothetical protein ACFSC4_16150 [Deinococcus malanensis]|uniref:hypothetical protein n=1 Tax=Deinococcus malanensis TaxID=1706855 RepID=UPI003631D036